MKKLYLLERIEIIDEHGFSNIDFDEIISQVVVADSEQMARGLCSFGDEGKDVWLDTNQSKCKELIADDLEYGVIDYSYLHG